MVLKNSIIGLIILAMLSFVSAFGVNYFSPKGIALFGQWDVSKGAVSARSKQNDPFFSELEIKDVLIAKEIYDEGDTVFVDARAPEDYIEGHIKGAVSMPLNLFDEKIDDFLKTYPIHRQIITYCSGRECEDSHQLAVELMNAGYAYVRIFIDGYAGWEERGYPIEK